MLAFLGIVDGILLLTGGGTARVAGAHKAGARFGVSPMLVGLFICSAVRDLLLALVLTALLIPIFYHRQGETRPNVRHHVAGNLCCLRCLSYKRNLARDGLTP